MALWSRKSTDAASDDATTKPVVPNGHSATATVGPPGAIAPAVSEPSPSPSQPTSTVAAEAPALSAEAKRAALARSKRAMAAFGEITTVLIRTAQYRNMAISELEWLVVPAIQTGQFSLAELQSKTDGNMMPVAVVLWASVSAEIDARLRASDAVPIKLQPDEWRTGEQLWIIDAVGEPRLMQAMLKRLSENEWRGKSVSIKARDKDGIVRNGQLKVESPTA